MPWPKRATPYEEPYEDRSTADSVVVAAELGSDWGTSGTRLNPIAADFWMRSIALSHAESS